MNTKIVVYPRRIYLARKKVHVIYDIADGVKETEDILRIVKETSGLYRDIDPESESRKLRRSWDRDAQ